MLGLNLLNKIKMKTKFTKGNWFVKETKIDGADIICQAVLMTDLKYTVNKSPIVCDLYGYLTEDGKANAKLLCAAPDMYFALESLLSELEDCSLPSSMNFYIHNAKVALNKAVGL